MKANEVLNLLRITRKTLHVYAATGDVDSLRSDSFLNSFEEFNMLIKQIRYKAEEIGINVITHDESHTSKCSFLHNESIEHQETYMGERIGRGVFRSKNGILIHADLQAAYNIIRKAVPEAFADGIEGIVLYQRSSSIPESTGMTTSKGGC